jgi:hypothetical protein
MDVDGLDVRDIRSELRDLHKGLGSIIGSFSTEPGPDSVGTAWRGTRNALFEMVPTTRSIVLGVWLTFVAVVIATIAVVAHVIHHW